MNPIRKLVHIDTANKVSVADKATRTTTPHPAFGFVLLPTSGTLATCSSFRASEAQDAGLFRFVGKVINVFAILPQGHALIMVPTTITVAYAVRVADEETSHLVLNTEVNHLTGGFVPHISDTAFRALTYLILGTLQLLPPTRILLAVGRRQSSDTPWNAKASSALWAGSLSSRPLEQGGTSRSLR